MAEGCVFTILGKIGSCLVDPIWSWVKLPFCYNNNTEELRKEVEHLKRMIVDVRRSVDAANDNFKEIGEVSNAWVEESEKMKKAAKEFLESIEGVENRWCLNGWCCDRYSLSREAKEKAERIVELRGNGNKYTKLAYTIPLSRIVSKPPHGFVKFESRVSTTEEVIKALENDEIDMIVICGMPGVGKTTIVNQVKARAEVQSLFRDVVMTVVSQEQDIFKIQSELGRSLGIGDHATAYMLRTRLANGKRNLVILDDVWDSFDLHAVGIPVGGEWKGCKLVLTSRNDRVYNEMDIEKKRIFRIRALLEEEALNLFKKKAEIGVDTPPNLQAKAEEVAKECAGLPLAIVTVATALKNRNISAWNDTLRQLRNSTIDKKVILSIQLSYNYLGDHYLGEQAKLLFLLCCVFPEDYKIPIEKLFRFVVGLRMFDDIESLEAMRDRVDSLEAMRDRVDSLVDKLISYHLLIDVSEDEDIYGDRSVKIHDVIRDVGRSIAPEKYLYEVAHGTELKEWPQNNRHQTYTAIYLIAHEMVELPADLHFSKLKLLQIESANYLRPQARLRDSLGEMGQLQVIGVEGMDVEFLAPPLNFWKNLRTLYLDRCQLSNDISFIGSLEKLEILSFFQSKLHELPSEIGQLCNLKLLDLRCSCSPTSIPSGVLSSLQKLEELYMESNFFSVSEIHPLSRLKVLQFAIRPGPAFLLELKNFPFDNLKRFSFDRFDSFDRFYSVYPRFSYQLSNSLLLEEVDMGVVRESKVNVLGRRTEVLKFIRMRDLKNVLKYIDAEMRCENLKDLSIGECDEVECVIDADDRVPDGVAFINLESLDILNMDNLTEICRGNLPSGFFKMLQKATLEQLPAMKHLWRGPIQPPSLGNLRYLHIFYCNAIESVFPHSVVKCLVQLQNLRIGGCEMLEKVVSREVREDEKDIIEFPKLEKLFFAGLPKLRSFYPTSDNGTIQTLFIHQQVCFLYSFKLRIANMCFNNT